MKIQAILDRIIASVPGAPFPKTVDTLKIGDPSAECTGIVVTFLATVEVIEQAAALGANLIITHEPTFYSHFDEDKGIESDSVVLAKRRLLDSHGLVIWRFHDYLHKLNPDPTVAGIAGAMGWTDYLIDMQPPCCYLIPTLTLRDLLIQIKARLNLSAVRFAGNLAMPCAKIGILPGFPGRDRQIALLEGSGMDVVITGEMHEWETPEYGRDAARLGMNKALIILGHAASEEPGMRWIMPFLQEHAPGIAMTFIATGSPFQEL